MKSLKVLSVLSMVLLVSGNAMAFDLPTTCAVEIVEGITIAQTTQMNFGQVADHDGALVVLTNPATPMTDTSFISFDDTGYTPGIFTCTSIPGASVNASFTNTADVPGLTLSAFTVSLDNGGSNEALLTDITQLATADTWNVGATLTVASATAMVGASTPGYTITVVLN